MGGDGVRLTLKFWVGCRFLEGWGCDLDVLGWRRLGCATGRGWGRESLLVVCVQVRRLQLWGGLGGVLLGRDLVYAILRSKFSARMESIQLGIRFLALPFLGLHSSDAVFVPLLIRRGGGFRTDCEVLAL